MITEPSELSKTDVSLRPSRPSTSKFGLRFSLLSLLTVAAIACVAAAFYGTRQREAAAVRRLESLRAQVKVQQEQIAKLRAELGHLTIYDKDKVHVLQLPTRDQQHWKWRVYLPPQWRWKLHAGAGQVPATGYRGAMSFGISTLDGGEFTLELFAEKDRAGQPQMVYRTATSTISTSIPAAGFEQLTKNGFSWQSSGRRLDNTTAVYPPGQPVELMRLRTNQEVVNANGSRSFQSTNDPQFGFLVWVEEDKPSK